MLEDPEKAAISPAERSLFAFVRSVNGRSFELRDEEVRAVQSAGWSDEAIYDAVTVSALFNFYNRWCDATGVSATSEEAHRESGKRLARFGYAP